MISITEAQVDASAPNADAIKNGRALVSKGKLTNLRKSSDGVLIFGECSGSGSNPYHCSVDFMDQGNPTYRCSCPSRQFPCKHTLGLLYAYAMNKPFSEAEIPPDLAAKREKLQARVEKKVEKSDKPRTVNKSALKKKITAQLQGLDVLESLISDIVMKGLGTLDAKSAMAIDQQAKQLGDAFLPGAQGVLNELTALFRGLDGRFQTNLNSTQRDANYREALERLTRAHALAKRGREYLQQRLTDEEMKPDTSTSIAAWLGHAWQLAELDELGCSETDVELVQLSFEMETNHARQQFLDTGVWFHAKSGKLVRTLNIRPFKAAAYIRQDDSVFEAVVTPKLYLYPGEGANRVRWDSQTYRSLTSDDFGKIRAAAAKSVAEIVKTAREQLKSPLAERNVWVLIHFAQVGKVGDAFVLQDASGGTIELVNHVGDERPPALPLLSALPPEGHRNHTMLGCVRQDWERNQLVMEPVSLVTENMIVRLGY